MMRHWSWWVTLLVGVTFAAVAVLAIVTYSNSASVRESEQAIARSHENRELIVELLSSLKDAETGQRGYLLTGEETYLAPYHASKEKTDLLLAKLKTRLNDWPEQLSRLTRLESLVAEKRSELAHTIELRRQDVQGRGFENAQEATLTDEGRRLMREIRSLCDDLLAHEERVLVGLLDDAEERANSNERMILVGNLLALTLLAAAGGAIYIERQKRNQMETRLANNQERLGAVINSALDGIITVDQQMKILMMNPAAESIFGCTDSEMLGKPISLLIPSGRSEFDSTEIGSFFHSDERRRVIADGLSRRSDGTLFPFEGALTKSIVNGIPFATLMFRDLSERESSRAKIREQATALDQINDAVHIRDLQDRITYWNRGSEKLYGWTSSEAVGRRVSELMSPERAPEREEADRIVQETGTWLGELKQVTKQGRPIIVEQRRTLLRDASGRPTGQLVINIDITERKRIETQTRRSQRLESIGTLAGGIAHDLNNVLTPILMGSNLLAKEQSAETRVHLLDTIRAGAERGANMIKQLLSFAGGTEGGREIVDILAIVREVEGILQHTLPKSVEVEVKCADGLWEVRGDPTELSQVLMNLSINARDAMPQGGKLTFELQNLTARGEKQNNLDLLTAGKYVQLTISDTGCGMSADVLEKAFDPFFTTKEQGRGTGLGLAISQGIVRSHGGTINCYSEPGIGTKFTIYLPAQLQNIAHAFESHVEQEMRGHGETILVVDDELLILETARMALDRAGYRVLTAEGGASALAMLQNEQVEPAAVIVDMMMPEMDGQTTIDAIRKLQPAVPVIASSGLRRPDSGERGVASAQAFLSKPYSEYELLQILRRVIDRTTSPIA